MDEILENMKEDYNPDIYTLTDQDGVDQQFELLDILEIDDNRYFALIPYFDDSTEMLDDDGELVILKSRMDDGNEMMETIDDDKEFEKIGKIFLERISEMFEDDSDD